MHSAADTLAHCLNRLQASTALPAIALGLERVLVCLERLGNPQLRLPPTIHIAGTNGKGSTLAILRALFEGEGKTVHCYTSPHLVRFNERIVLAGNEVSDEALLAALNQVLTAAADDIPLTFFEATTLAAFLCFAESTADVLLLEVGMGGRLDATNVIDKPLLSVVAPISIDHAEFLGNTLASIAAEKAGIIKCHVPVVSAEQVPEVEDVLRAKAAECAAPFIVARANHAMSAQLSLEGAHQAINLGCALQAFSLAQQRMGFEAHSVNNSLVRVRWPARLQKLTVGDLVQAAYPATLWLDGGHNPAGAAALAAWARGSGKPCGLIVGMMKRKDIRGFLEPFLPLSLAIATVDVEGEGEASTADDIASVARAMGFSRVAACGDVASALRWHKNASLPADANLLICGSLYLAGKVLQNHA